MTGAVNGKKVAVWSGQKTSPDYGSTWGFCKTQISLAPGKNVLTVTAPTGGTLIGAMVLEQVQTYAPAAAEIDSSCVENLGLGVSGNLPAPVGKGSSVWEVYTGSNGLLWLVDRASGKLLTSDGTSLALSDSDRNGSGQWQKTGEAENYDYLVHAASGKVLAVDANGKLILDARSNYQDGDMRTNRAYWYFHSPS